MALAALPAAAATWTQVSTFPASWLTAGTVSNASVPIVVGVKSDAIQLSKDTGKTWGPISGPAQLGTITSGRIQGGKVWIGSDSAGVAVSSDGDKYALSSTGMDFGLSSTNRSPPLRINDVLAGPSSTYIAAAIKGTYASSDGGASWIYTAAGDGLPSVDSLFGGRRPVYALAMHNSVIVAGTDAGIYRSVNGGSSWAFAGVAGGSIRSIAFANNAGYALVDNVGLYVSTDAGASWALNTAYTAGTPSSLFASPDASSAYIGSTNGAVVKTTDAGKTYNTLSDATLTGGSIVALTGLTSPSETVWAATSQGIFQADGGVAVLSVAPRGPYDFGQVRAGAVSSVSLTVSNSGSAAASLTNFAALTAPFAISSNSCGSSLAAGGNCQVTVSYSPTAADATAGAVQTTRLAFPSSAALSPYVFTGTPIAAAATGAVLTLAPAGPFNFGEVVSGKTASTTLTLKNTGKEAAQLTGFAGLSGPFSLTQDCDNPLKAGGSCVLTISYGPSDSDVSNGPSSASLVVSASVSVGGSPYAVMGTPKAGPVSTTPSQFSFTPFTGAQTNDFVESGPVTITGITKAVPISISGGTYTITRAGATVALGSASSTVLNNDVVRVTVQSSATPSTAKTATLTAGGVSGSFVVTTAPAFAVPATNQNPELGVSVTTKSKVDPNTQQTLQDLVLTLDLTPGGFAAAPVNHFAAGGAQYKVYVAAIVPAGSIGLPQTAVFLKDISNNWVGVGSPLAAYLENVLLNSQDSKIKINVLQDFNFGLLSGVEFYIGYGTSDGEMLSSGRYRGFYKVP